MDSLERKNRGRAGEIKAEEFLKEQGYVILHCNYRFDRGEIDIIAQDGIQLVFVEVKVRHSPAFGSPEEAVTEQKEMYLKRTAEGYLHEHGLDGKPCRFDIIAIEWNKGSSTLRHSKDVF